MLYSALYMGWKGKATNWVHYERAYAQFAWIATPLVLSAYTCPLTLRRQRYLANPRQFSRRTSLPVQYRWFRYGGDAGPCANCCTLKAITSIT